MTTPWAAPTAGSPVRATVVLPGSKSVTNRALVLAALADGPSRIARPLRARDTLLMAAGLRDLGVGVDDDGDDWLVTPRAPHGAVIDVGLAGTVMRFLPPVAALAAAAVTFDGDDRARERPMDSLIDGLRQAGTTIEDAGRGRLPFTVRGSGAVPGGTVRIDASASSQFVSGLLLAAARFDKGLELVHCGRGPVPSTPHIDMTLGMLADAGVGTAHPDAASWLVEPGPIRAGDRTVEPDLSNAAPFLAAAVLTGGRVTVPGWPARTTQAGDRLRELLAAFGATVELDAAGLTVGRTGSIRGIDVDLHDVGELTPVLAAIAAVADGPTRLRGIGHLRGHETDRLAALAHGLTGLGAGADATVDGLHIRPAPLHAGTWQAHADHRMAQAGAVLGLVVPGVVVDDIACTGKTLPDFPGMWADALAGAAGR